MAENEIKPTKKKTKKAVEPEIYQVKVAVPWLNVRRSNGYGAEILRVIKADTICEITETVDGWGKLSTDEGWICLEFVVKE